MSENDAGSAKKMGQKYFVMIVPLDPVHQGRAWTQPAEFHNLTFAHRIGVADCTAVRKWQWLFVIGCECKCPVPTATRALARV